MAVQVKPLSEFIARFRKEGHKIPITWLIGAGMSASAGIPLAKGISQRIIMFEYLMSDVTGFRPWDESDKTEISYTNNDLPNFFEWFEQAEKEPGETFNSIMNAAANWLSELKEFKDISPEHPECYQLLFKHFFQSADTSNKFITGLVARAKGINLANLGLAGLLRDHREWGHTVFTTNFDDLLLRSLLNLNHNARVFGESNQKEIINATTPPYPQIVHLHGRHTGYRLLNTKEQLDLINPHMQAEFMKHIQDTNLIVLGYAGWDDVVMNTLKELQKSGNTVRGSIFWVPYKDRTTILPQTRDLLEKWTPNSAYIIENDEGKPGLDADSFMLAMCDFINKGNDGFTPYRKGIISYAKTQQEFTFKQLKDYPDHDPDTALTTIKNAKKALLEQNFIEATRLKEAARKQIAAEDISDKLKGKVLQEIGIIELLQRNYKDAVPPLLEAIGIWKKIDEFYGKAWYRRAVAQCAVGEAYLMLNEVDEAITNIRHTVWLYESQGRFENPLDVVPAYLLLVIASLRKGNNDNAKISLDKVEKILTGRSINDHISIFAPYLFIKGNYCIQVSRTADAERHLENALLLYQELNNSLQVANVKKNLADIYTKKGEVDKAEELLGEALAVFIHLNDPVGEANVYYASGDLFYVKEDPETAIYYYTLAVSRYREQELFHNLINVMTDLYLLLKAEERLEEALPMYEELQILNEKYANRYSKQMLSNVHTQNHVEEKEEDEEDEQEEQEEQVET